MNYPLVSVVILNFNGKKNLGGTLIRFISSVLDSDYPNLEVIFFDNGSTDGSVEFVKHEFHEESKLKIISNSKNCGFSEGNNKALKHAKGEYVVLLNNDVEVKPDSIGELVKAMESDNKIGVAQSKIMFLDRVHIQTVGNVLDWTLSTYLIGNNEEDRGQYDTACEIMFPCGACAILRKDMISKTGLFDPDYFFYHDDCDLGWRARLAGYKVIYNPSSIVYHKGEGTSLHSFQRNTNSYYLSISRVGLFIKNLALTSMLKLGIPFFVNLGRDMFTLLLQGDIQTPIRITFWAFRGFKENWKRRQIVQNQIRKISDRDVFKYFIDYSVFLLIMHKNIRKLLRRKIIQDNFEKSVNQITAGYYKKHSYPT